MAEKPPTISRKQTAILLAVGIVILLLLLPTLNISMLSHYMERVGLLPIALSFISINIGVVFYSLGWYILSERKIPFLDAFLISYASLFMNLLIPTGSTSGEAFRVYMGGKVSDLSGSEVLSTIVAHRVVMLIPFLTSVALGISYLPALIGQSLCTALLALLLIVIGATLLVKMSMTEKYLLRVIDLAERALKKDLSNMRRYVRDYTSTFLRLLQRRNLLILALLCAFANWIFDMLPIFIYSYSLGIDIDVFLGTFIYSFSIIMILIPLGIPGNTGVREWAMTGLLVLVGIDKTVAGAVTILSSTLTVFLNELIFGFVCYLLVLRRISKSSGS